MREEKKHEIAISCIINRDSEKIIAYEEGIDILAEHDYDTEQFLTCCDKSIINMCLLCCGIGICADECYFRPKNTRKALIRAFPEFRKKIIDELSVKYEWEKANIRLSLIFPHEKDEYMEAIFIDESLSRLGYGTFYTPRKGRGRERLDNPFLTPTPR